MVFLLFKLLLRRLLLFFEYVFALAIDSFIVMGASLPKFDYFEDSCEHFSICSGSRFLGVVIRLIPSDASTIMPRPVPLLNELRVACDLNVKLFLNSVDSRF